MRLEASTEESTAILAAMRDVAETGSALTERDRVTLVSAGRWMLGLDEADVDSLPSSTPGILATALPEAALRQEATRFLAIMPFVDGALDKAKIARVEDYAHTLGVADGYLDESPKRRRATSMARSRIWFATTWTAFSASRSQGM
jgi:hypothetical protein